MRAEEQQDVNAVISLLQCFRPVLRIIYSSSIAFSGHVHLRELRVQYVGRSYCIPYAFDSRRTAILLIGGEKTGLTCT